MQALLVIIGFHFLDAVAMATALQFQNAVSDRGIRG
jgi:hypothetical protein